MLQPAGVVIVLNHVDLVGKAAGHAELYLIFRLVRPVPAFLFRLPEDGDGKAALSRQLCHVVLNAVFIEKLRLLKLPGSRFIPEAESNALIHHRLPFHHVGKIRCGDGNVGEHIQIRKPPGSGAGLFRLAFGQRLLLQLANNLAPLKVETVFKTIPPDGDIHVAGGVLGGAGAQTIQAQGILIIVAGDIVILAAGVQLAVHQLPVVPLLFLVPVHRAAPAQIFHFNGAVGVPGDGNGFAMAFPGLVNGVGENLKHRMLAAVQSVGSKNDAGPLPDPVCALQGRDTFVAVIVLLDCHELLQKAETAVKSIEVLYHTSTTPFKCPAKSRHISCKFLRFTQTSQKCYCVKFYITGVSPGQNTCISGFYTFSTGFSTLLCQLWKFSKNTRCATAL